MPDTGHITEQNYPAFRRAYRQAVKEGKESFIFEGHKVLTAYAKYVVEYLDGKGGDK